MRSSNSRRHPQRSFPEWTPPCIRDLAQILYNDAKRHKVRAKDEKSFYRVTLDPRMKRVWDELKKRLKDRKADEEILHRLTLDPRMKRVWDELLKKKRLKDRKTEQYLHPTATSDGGKRFWSFRARSLQSRAEELRKRGEGREADRVQVRATLVEMEVPNIFSRLQRAKFEPQEQGLIFLFYTAFKFAQETPQSVSVAEERKAAGRFRAMAKTIRADVAAQKQRMSGYFDHRLLDAACAYEELADDAVGSLGTVVLVSRKARSEPRLKGFVMALASTTNVLFGVPLYRTVATVTNVALNRSDVTGDKVRKMLS
jgi:hypothetical protein